MPTPAFILQTMPTPLGDLQVVADDAGRLRAVDWLDHDARMRLLLRRYYGKTLALVPGEVAHPLVEALHAYFAGELGAIDALPCELTGTPFQRSVWLALRAIPAGQTLSYAALAQRIGAPAAVRAVGLANGANPISLVLPCHRVIGSNGTLTGYGGGLPRKRWLLAHEAQCAGGHDTTVLGAQHALALS